MSEPYEIRFDAYPNLKIGRPAYHVIRGLNEAIAQWDAYAADSDCQTFDWQDRANKEDCWRDWWDADWIEPEADE
jgi:hypothetical protein